MHWREHEALLASGGYPPSPEQAAKGWSQDWEAWKPRPVWTAPEGAQGRIVSLDFTGGPLVRAAKKQAESEEHRAAAGPLKAAPLKRSAAPPVPLVAKLCSGATIPQLGLGTWKSKPGEVHDAVLYALTQAGYRHIDCAAIYENEGEVGSALAEVFTEWDVRREDVFITSKLWNSDHAAARVEPAVRKCLKLLQLEYLDLWMIHWPITGSRGDVLSPSTKETWQAMEALVDQGLVRHLGLSNFSVAKMREIQSYARIPIAVCQAECSPRFCNTKLVQFCESSGIHYTAFSPLGSPDSASIFTRSGPPLMEDPVVRDVTARSGKNTGQVLIKWALQTRPNSSVLPKSVSAGRILGNAAMEGWQLSAEDQAALSELKPQERMVHGGVFLSPAGPYRTLKDLWDVEDDEA